MSDGDRSPTATAGWLRPVEAAAALGVSPEAIRARIRRGTLEARPGNDGRVRVLVTLPERSATTMPNGHDRAVAATRPVDDATRPGGAATVVADDELAMARERAARAEGEAAVLREALAKAEARADRLEAVLVEARRPWLAKVLDGLRRKGS